MKTNALKIFCAYNRRENVEIIILTSGNTSNLCHKTSLNKKISQIFKVNNKKLDLEIYSVYLAGASPQCNGIVYSIYYIHI